MSEGLHSTDERGSRALDEREREKETEKKVASRKRKEKVITAG